MMGEVDVKKKPSMPPEFGMATFKPVEVISLCNKTNFLFNYSPTHLSLMSFWFGWVCDFATAPMKQNPMNMPMWFGWVPFWFGCDTCAPLSRTAVGFHRTAV